MATSATSTRLRDGRRATMGSSDSLLPRPANGTSATSPRFSTRSPRQATVPNRGMTSPRLGTALAGSLSAGDWHGMFDMFTGGSNAPGSPALARTTRATNPAKKALDTRSVVTKERAGGLKERDGYDVFFGVAEGDGKAKGQDRDGFDIFYGIKNAERSTAARTACSVSASEDVDGDESAAKQLRARIGQVAHPRRERRLTAPPQSPSTWSGGSFARTSDGATANFTKSSSKLVSKTKPDATTAKHYKAVVPESVPIFSLATPASSFAPPVPNNSNGVPDGVQLYSMATPCSSFAPPAQ